MPTAKVADELCLCLMRLFVYNLSHYLKFFFGGLIG
jgi:hypothetical protein